MGKRPSLDFNLIEDDALREKLLRVRGMYAHTNPGMTFMELLHKLCDEKLEEQIAAQSGEKPKKKSVKKGKSPAAPPGRTHQNLKIIASRCSTFQEARFILLRMPPLPGV